MPHQFEDEPGTLFCVNQGFVGTSFMEFEDLEEASMACIGMELTMECRSILIEWCSPPLSLPLLSATLIPEHHHSFIEHTINV